MERDLLKIISDGMKKTLDRQPPALMKVGQLMLDDVEKYRRRAETGEGNPVAWVMPHVPPELLLAMDIVPIYSNTIIAWTNQVGFGSEYIDLSDQRLTDCICSSWKAQFGVLETGDCPPPDMLIATGGPCDSSRTVFPTLAGLFDIPYFVIDEPYFRSERSYQYIAREMKRLVSFLEEATNRKLDIDKLKQVMEYSNTAHEYFNKLNEFRLLVPSPFTSSELFADILFQMFTGTPEAADYTKTRYHEMKGRVDRGEFPKIKEIARVVWPYGMYVEDLSIFSWMEEKYGAVSVSYMRLNCGVKPVEDISTYDGILRGLAEKSVQEPMNREFHGPITNYIDTSIDLIRDTKADCAIILGHVGCKSMWAAMKLIKDQIEEECGVPLLVFEMDVFDRRYISPDGVRAKIGDFFEMRVLQGIEKKKKE